LTPRAPRLPEAHAVRGIAKACAEAGGRALVVGGWVRDQLRGEPREADVDLEIFGLSVAAARDVLARFGRVRRVGRAFPIQLVRELGLEVSVAEPGVDFETAARRRDLRINAMGWDPLSGELLDPHGGRADLAAGVLRATDPAHFGDDPLRGLRTAQLAARFEMAPDAELRGLCAATDLGKVPAERIFGELRRLLLRAARPSIAFGLLHEVGLLRFFPELAALVGTPQDPEWHPEGDVWVHNQLVIDRAAQLREGDEARDLLLMFGALCHDLGKPATTERREGRILSYKHSEAGIPPTHVWLERLRAPKWLVTGVVALVRHHLAPAQLTREANRAGPRAYRKLLRRLAAAGLDADLLERVARADHLGRTTEDALAGRFAAGDAFRVRAAEISAEPATHTDAVKGRHLLARGMVPGPEVGRILARCREIQDETGWTDPDAILARVLPEPGPGA
jgi:tRNA nucleotidyltransferase (CCA-adding enzyme)